MYLLFLKSPEFRFFKTLQNIDGTTGITGKVPMIIIAGLDILTLNSIGLGSLASAYAANNYIKL